MSVPRDEMAKHAMAELARQYPHLTLQQLMHAMTTAEWDLLAHPVKVSIRVPNTDQPVTVEIQHAPAADLSRELG